MSKENKHDEDNMKPQAEDPDAHRAPGDHLTEQRQPKDAGPRAGKFPVGQHNAAGRPPLMKK